MIARMQIRQTAWESLLANLGLASDEIQTLINTGCTKVIEDAQNPAGFILVNCIGPETRLDELYNYFGPTDHAGYWKWNFNGTVDFASEYTGQYNDILGTQPVDSTFQDPLWSHGWLGQKQNRFARSVTRGFGEGFR